MDTWKMSPFQKARLLEQILSFEGRPSPSTGRRALAPQPFPKPEEQQDSKPLPKVIRGRR